MTSAARYRLVLRQDNADQRLTRRGYEIGLVPEKRLGRWRSTPPSRRSSGWNTPAWPLSGLTAFLTEHGTADAPDGCSLLSPC